MADRKEKPHELVIKLMGKQKLTVRQLAERSGVSPSTVQNVKEGKNVRLETFLLVMKGLGFQTMVKNRTTTVRLNA